MAVSSFCFNAFFHVFFSSLNSRLFRDFVFPFEKMKNRNGFFLNILFSTSCEPDKKHPESANKCKFNFSFFASMEMEYVLVHLKLWTNKLYFSMKKKQQQQHTDWMRMKSCVTPIGSGYTIEFSRGQYAQKTISRIFHLKKGKKWNASVSSKNFQTNLTFVFQTVALSTWLHRTECNNKAPSSNHLSLNLHNEQSLYGWCEFIQIVSFTFGFKDRNCLALLVKVQFCRNAFRLKSWCKYLAHDNAKLLENLNSRKLVQTS